MGKASLYRNEGWRLGQLNRTVVTICAGITKARRVEMREGDS
jgi:hypothetical protein